MNKHNVIADEKKNSFIIKSRERKIYWRDILVILIISVSLHAVFSFRSFSDPDNRQIGDDALAYRTLAENIIDGHGFGRIKPVGPGGSEIWIPEFCWTPGYPAIIAVLGWLTGHCQSAIVIFQQLLGILLCLMIMVICQRHFGRKAGLVAGLLYALDLQAVGLSNMLVADFIFSFILFCVVLLIVKFIDGGSVLFSLGAGLLLGFGILEKPVGMPLPVVLLTFLLIYAFIKRRIRLVPAAIIVLVAAYLPVLGWTVRNGIVVGEYAFSSQTKLTPVGLASTGLAKSNGISRTIARDSILANTGVSYLQLRYLGLSSEESHKVREAAIPIIFENKYSLIKEWAISSVKLFFCPEKLTLQPLGLPYIAFGIQRDQTNLSDVSITSLAILAFETLLLGITYVMLFITLWKCIKYRRMPTLILFCLVVALPILGLSSMPGTGDPRYRSQVIPLLVVFAAGFCLNRQSKLSQIND